MLYKNLETASLREIISFTLRENRDSETVNEVLKNFSNFSDLIDATIEEIKQIKGIGPKKATALAAAIELGRRLFLAPETIPTVIRGPEDVFQMAKDMQFLTKENLKVIYLNTKNHVLCIETVSIGTLNSTLVSPREVFRGAIKRSAASLIVLHNHPSTISSGLLPEPSREDIEITKRLAEVGNLVGIELLDHVIIGRGKYVSLKEKGLM